MEQERDHRGPGFNFCKVTDLVKGASLWFALGSLGILLGCDIPHEALICNGFQEPITVFYVSKSVPQFRKLPMKPGKCMEPSRAIPASDQDSSVIEILPEGISVISETGQILARYEIGGVYMRPALHAAPHWLLTERGIFRVPIEFQSTWASDTNIIQKLSQPATPNLLEEKRQN